MDIRKKFEELSSTGEIVSAARLSRHSQVTDYINGLYVCLKQEYDEKQLKNIVGWLMIRFNNSSARDISDMELNCRAYITAACITGDRRSDFLMPVIILGEALAASRVWKNNERIYNAISDQFIQENYDDIKACYEESRDGFSVYMNRLKENMNPDSRIFDKSLLLHIEVYFQTSKYSEAILKAFGGYNTDIPAENCFNNTRKSVAILEGSEEPAVEEIINVLSALRTDAMKRMSDGGRNELPVKDSENFLTAVKSELVFLQKIISQNAELFQREDDEELKELAQKLYKNQIMMEKSLSKGLSPEEKLIELEKILSFYEGRAKIAEAEADSVNAERKKLVISMLQEK